MSTNNYPKGRGGYGADQTARVYDAIFEAGAAGATYQQIEQRSGVSREKVIAFCTNLCGKSGTRRRMIYRLAVFGKIRLCFDSRIPLDVAQAAVDAMAAPMREQSRAKERARNRRNQAIYKAARIADPAYQLAKAQRAAERQAQTMARKAQAEERRRLNAEAKDAARATEAKKRQALLNKHQRESAAINAMAQRAKGRFMGLVQADERPAANIDWSRAVVTVTPAKPGRYEVLEAPGPFSSLKPGQYAFEANSCAAREAA